MKQKISILGIRIDDRIKEAGHVQKLLSQHGCSIKTRLGLHEVTDNNCSTSGLILLELAGAKEDQTKLQLDLAKIQGITLKKMVF
jgi:hypothetical protein